MSLFELSSTLAPYLLVLMFAIIAGIFAWTYAPHRRRALEDASRIPFRDEPPA